MIELEAASKPAQYACIVLHGLGASGADLRPLAPSMWPEPKAKWLFPDAPEKSITINGGMRMRAWYDVRTPRLLDWEDESGIDASAQIANEIIDQQISAGIPARSIVLAGFSQGGVIALHAGLRRADPIGAIVALSCYLSCPTRLADEAAPAARATPIFLAAGQFDPIITLADTSAAAETLVANGNPTDFKQYPMAHAICPDEIADISSFLTANVSAEQIKAD